MDKNPFNNYLQTIILILFATMLLSNFGFCQDNYGNEDVLRQQNSVEENILIGGIVGSYLNHRINNDDIGTETTDHTNLELSSDNFLTSYSEFQNSSDMPGIIGEYELESFVVVYDNGLTITDDNIGASGKMSITSNILVQMLSINNENTGGAGTYEVQSNSSLLLHNILPIEFNSTMQYSFDGTHLTTTAYVMGYTETDTWKKTISYCNCQSGFTQNDIDAAREAGHQDCVNNPTSCGLYSQANLTTEYQRGCDECSNGSTLPPTLLSNVDIHIPEINYESPLGVVKFWVDLQFLGEQEGDLIWKLSDFGQE